MSHKKATPNHLRPTLEDLQVRENSHRQEAKVTVSIQAKWTGYKDFNPNFGVLIIGDEADVAELIAIARESGSLSDVTVEYII